jgi:amino acid transporter
MKEHLKECLRNFFIIVTCINVAMFVLGVIFQKDQQFGYEAFLYPIFYGALGSIPNLFMGKKEEPTLKQYVVRQILGALLCMVLLFAFMFAGKPVTSEILMIAGGVAISVILIFIAVDVITWILDSKTARDMTADLKLLQENAGIEE